MMVLAVKVIFSLPASGMVDKLASGRGNLTESVFIPAMSVCISRISSAQWWAMGCLGAGSVDVCSQRAVCTEMSSCSKGRTRRLIPAI